MSCRCDRCAELIVDNQHKVTISIRLKYFENLLVDRKFCESCFNKIFSADLEKGITELFPQEKEK